MKGIEVYSQNGEFLRDYSANPYFSQLCQDKFNQLTSCYQKDDMYAE